MAESLRGRRINVGKAPLVPIEGRKPFAHDPLGTRIPIPETGPGRGEKPNRKPGWVSLWAPNVGLRVTGRHVEAPQVIQERAGGWEERERPRQIPRVWRPTSGRLLKVRLVVMFDGFEPPKQSVQPHINALRRMGYRDHERGSIDPVIQIIGAVPYADGGLQPGYGDRVTEWVLERLEVVEEIHMSNGAPCRATATIELLEHVPGDIEIRVAKARRARPYKWRKGDTLSRVAKRELGASSRSGLIDKANPQVKRWSALKVGTTITIPAFDGTTETPRRESPRIKGRL